ncbi:MAG: DUF1080 domain-containing protein [Prevotellaceae bacterium]|jgi:hypothetical protein|nr:DUF1080 domain-containing protein [Prevotellaceae bacterium]
MKFIAFKNTVCTAAFVLSGLLVGAQTKTVDLFDGSTLKGWGFVLKEESKQSPEEVFTVKDGVIHITGTPFGYMYTRDKYENFLLHVEWRWPDEASNSGIFLFVQDDEKLWPNAIECQLRAGSAGDFVLLGGSDLAEYKTEPGQERPAFPVIKKRNESSENKTGEWNNATIICNRGRISVYINGTLQNTGSNPKYRSGRIALQSEGKDIQFRNIKITILEPRLQEPRAKTSGRAN